MLPEKMLPNLQFLWICLKQFTPNRISVGNLQHYDQVNHLHRFLRTAASHTSHTASHTTAMSHTADLTDNSYMLGDVNLKTNMPQGINMLQHWTPC